MQNIFYTKYGKRLFDLMLTIPGVVVISPILAVTAILVRIKLGSPVLFRQVRPGLHGKPFTIYKFRTMTDERDGEGKLLSNDERMTRFGMLLRSTSLDELPELWNVIKGEMSLVGPRPLLMDYLPYYDENKNRRHEVRPGITGWTQVKGRNALGWDAKFNLDTWYVDNFGFMLDLRILFLTFWKVFKREGITHKDNVAMPRFDEYMQQKSVSTKRKG